MSDISDELDEVRSLVGNMPNQIFDWLELSDEIRQEWYKGAKASDFGGHKGFVQKNSQAILNLIEQELENILDDLAVSDKHPRDVVLDRLAQLKKGQE